MQKTETSPSSKGFEKKRHLKFIHIGHHKCGSTFLQYEAIPKIKALSMMPMNAGGKTELHDAMMHLIRCDDLFYDENRVREALYSCDYNCISYENLMGHGSLEAGAGYMIAHTARRLKTLFDTSYILFVIRNQKTFLQSWYKDDVKYGYVCSFPAWLRRRKIYQQLNWLKFSPVIRYYQELFGKDNVKVILFEEMFQKDKFRRVLQWLQIPDEGIDDIDFGRKLNPSLSPLAYHMTRFVNRTFGSKANMSNGRIYRLWRRRGIPTSNAVSRAIGLRDLRLEFDGFEELVKDVYGDDNEKTSRLIGRDLTSLGYA